MCFGINLYDDPILGQLLLDQDDLLHTPDNEVPPRIIGTLLRSGKLLLTHAIEPAIARAKHDGHPANQHIVLDIDLVPLGVSYIHVDWGRVGDVSDATLVWHDVISRLILTDLGPSNSDVSEHEAEVGVCVTGDGGVGSDDLLDLLVDEVVERVNVLLHQSSQAEEGWH